jgi:hypothetical protein
MRVICALVLVVGLAVPAQAEKAGRGSIISANLKNVPQLLHISRIEVLTFAK